MGVSPRLVVVPTIETARERGLWMEVILAAGVLIQFLYPRHNYRGARRDLEHRRLLVQAVRSLDREPLDSTTIALDPYKDRGATLVTGWDLDRNAERSFYRESMKELQLLVPSAEIFRPLALALLKEGKFERLKELPDPRASWVAEYSKRFPGYGAA